MVWLGILTAGLKKLDEVLAGMENSNLIIDSEKEVVPTFIGDELMPVRTIPEAERAVFMPPQNSLSADIKQAENLVATFIGGSRNTMSYRDVVHTFAGYTDEHPIVAFDEFDEFDPMLTVERGDEPIPTFDFDIPERAITEQHFDKPELIARPRAVIRPRPENNGEILAMIFTGIMFFASLTTRQDEYITIDSPSLLDSEEVFEDEDI